MEKEISIKAFDGSGSFSAFVAAPDDRFAPAVIVIQEIFGVNKNLREICRKLAAQGFIAICPDLFWRQEPGIQLTDQTEAEWKRAFELFQGFSVEKGMDDLKATLGHMRTFAGCTGKVGVLGYCLGGKLAYLMATRTDAECSVSYYGVGLDELLGEAPAIKKPLLMHIAEKDKFVPPAAQEKIKGALGGNKNVEMHIYAGMDHAFTRIGGQHYDETAAQLANARSLDFLKKNLL